MNELEQKLQTLNKIRLNVNDVMFIVGCCKSKAYEIMTICKDNFNGRVGLFTGDIKTTSLFKALGIDLEEEINKTKLLLGK